MDWKLLFSCNRRFKSWVLKWVISIVIFTLRNSREMGPWSFDLFYGFHVTKLDSLLIVKSFILSWISRRVLCGRLKFLFFLFFFVFSHIRDLNLKYKRFLLDHILLFKAIFIDFSVWALPANCLEFLILYMSSEAHG